MRKISEETSLETKRVMFLALFGAVTAIVIVASLLTAFGSTFFSPQGMFLVGSIFVVLWVSFMSLKSAERDRMAVRVKANNSARKGR